MAGCQPSPISELVEKNNLWFKNDKLYTGKAYGTSKAINNEQIYKHFGLTSFGDSLILNIERGEIKRIDFYTSKGHFAKQEFKEDSIVQLEFYYTESGIWDVELISGIASFRNGKEHGLRTYYIHGNKIYLYYNNGRLESRITFRLNPSLLDFNEILVEETEYMSESNAQITKEYYRDGKTLSKKSEIDNDKDIRTTIIYDLDGKVYEKVINGQKVDVSIDGSVKTYNKGVGITLSEYKNGKKHGIERQYYTSGQLWVETTYQNGMMQGWNKRWYKNGVLALECTYIKNVINGNYRKWYDNGQLWEESIYKNAELITQKKWYNNGKPAFK